MGNFKRDFMRLLTLFIAINFICFKCTGQKQQPYGFTPYKIDTTLNTTLAKAKSKSEFNLPMIADGFWVFMDKNDYKEYVGNINAIKFFDTLQTYTDVVCDCMIKKNTIYLQGGIGYEGAIGFDLKIVGKLFNGRILLAGKGYKTNKSPEYMNEILFNSINQTLKIQSLDSLKLDKKMIGELFMESEDFFEKGEKTQKKLYMKVLFGCKLDDLIVL